MPSQIKIQQPGSKTKVVACGSSKTCANDRYSYNACEFMDRLLWEMSGFLLCISNQMQR